MRWAVMGAGATGGYFGAMLARGGEEVAFIARGAQETAIRRHGVRVRRGDGEVTARGFVTNDPAAVPPVDVVIFAVKSYDTELAASAISPLMGPDTAIICIQNGVENEDVLAERYGVESILGASTRIEATIIEPGVIGHFSPIARIDLGPWGGALTARDREIGGRLAACGVDAHLDADVRRIKWEKFLFICPAAAVTGVTRTTIRDAVAQPETAALMRAAVAEVAAVAEAAGVPLGEGAADRIVLQMHGMPPTMKASMLRDLERGGRIELEAFSGAVRRIGARHAIATPTHDFLYAALRPAAAFAERGNLARA